MTVIIVIVMTIITKMTMAIAIRIAIIIIIIIIIISIYEAFISLTLLGALQYHKKCYSIKTRAISKKIRYKSINEGKVW